MRFRKRIQARRVRRFWVVDRQGGLRIVDGGGGLHSNGKTGIMYLVSIGRPGVQRIHTHKEVLP